jgi:hypothetical protein
MAPNPAFLALFALLAAALASTHKTERHLTVRDATPGCDSCLTNSLFTPLLALQGLYFHASYIFTTPAHQNSWGYVNFTLANPAIPGATTQCKAQSDQLETFFYGNQWYTCTPPASTNGTKPTSGPLSASFRYFFSETESRIDVNQTWACAEGSNS